MLKILVASDVVCPNMNYVLKVIKELTVQRARSELLTVAMEIELRSHRQLQKLLTAISLLLQKISTRLHDGMASSGDCID